jgi:hypothetical protein
MNGRLMIAKGTEWRRQIDTSVEGGIGNLGVGLLGLEKLNAMLLLVMEEEDFHTEEGL